MLPQNALIKNQISGRNKYRSIEGQNDGFNFRENERHLKICQDVESEDFKDARRQLLFPSLISSRIPYIA